MDLFCLICKSFWWSVAFDQSGVDTFDNVVPCWRSDSGTLSLILAVVISYFIVAGIPAYGGAWRAVPYSALSNPVCSP